MSIKNKTVKMFPFLGLQSEKEIKQASIDKKLQQDNNDILINFYIEIVYNSLLKSGHSKKESISLLNNLLACFDLKHTSEMDLYLKSGTGDLGSYYKIVEGKLKEI